MIQTRLMQVKSFRTTALALVTEPDASVDTEEDDGTSVAKLFEEVKVMFQDLPSRIERRFDPDYSPSMKRRRRTSTKAIYELIHGFGGELPEGVGLLVASSQFRDEFPWLYEMALEAYRYIVSSDSRTVDALQKLDHAFHATFDHPAMREIGLRSRERFGDAELMMEALHKAISVARERVHRSVSLGENTSTGWSDDRLELLREMWAEGKTATEIAETLGKVSRNAVIGKAHRLGLAARPAPTRSTGDEV